jgi:DNA-binding MarR family transcriptional regulator
MVLEQGEPEIGSAVFEEIIDEITSLFHLLHTVAAQHHGGGKLTAGRRGILRGLDRLGPQTVPQMARARPVSRQYIQMLVNELEAEGLVEVYENHAHRRSRLVRLAAAGRDALAAMRQREAELYTILRIPVTAEELRKAAGALRRVREALLAAQLRHERGGL